MKQKYCSFIGRILFLSLLILGCHDNPPSPLDVVYGDEAYRIQPPRNGINLEYNVSYYFLPGEPRLIYVYGIRPANYTRVVCYDHNMQQQDLFDLTSGGKSYYRTGTGEYTAPLDVTAPNANSGSYNYRLEINDGAGNNSQISLTVAIIPQRDYQIEYSCMTGYDIRTQGYFYPNNTDYLKPYKDAFTEANTTFKDPTIGNVAIGVDNVIQNANDIQYLITWGDQFASGGPDHDPSKVVLFSVDNYVGSGLATGKTASISLTNGTKAYCFVFLNRCSDLFPSKTAEEIKVLKTRTAIHELTHGRRKNLSIEYYDDVAPPYGFDLGIYFDNCIVRQIAEWDPQKAFHLCDGHRQLLMNIYW